MRYDWTCPTHQTQVEVSRSIADRDVPPTAEEGRCCEEMHRAITAMNFALKGPGWFKDGYSKEGKKK